MVPNDAHLFLTLDDIGLLNETAYTHGGIDIENSFSISLWFFAQTLTGTQVLVSQEDTIEEASGWSLSLQEGELCFRVRALGADATSISATLADAGKCYHVVGIVDLEKQSVMLCVNGQIVAQQETTTRIFSRSLFPKTPPQLRFGGYTDPAGGHFDHTFGRDGSGWIDDFRFYMRALNAEEVAQFVDLSNRPPQAHFSIIPEMGDAPVTVDFDASISRDPDGTIRHYFWNFGDRTFGKGQIERHHYPYAGRYRVRLTAVDDDYAVDQTEQVLHVGGRKNPLRITPVFVNGEDGHACYRIPAIIRAANGDLIAFAEGRVASCSDSTEAIRLVAKRSKNNGETWGDLQIVARHLADGKECAIQNISPVVDSVHGTGRVVLVYNKTEYNEWEVADGKGINRIATRYSEDHGMSWQDERDITLQVHRPYNPAYRHVYRDAARLSNREADWRNQRPTLGHAIQLALHPVTRGRFLFVGSFTRGDTSVFDAYNYLFWSDDLGESWQIGGVNDGQRVDGTSTRGLNEATAVELENGTVMINSRNYQNGKPVGRRAVTIADFNEKGEVSFQPTYHDEALITSGVQASMIRFTRSTQPNYGSRSRIIFANPSHPRARYRLTLRLSYDEGRTWPISRVVDPGPAAYSDLVIQNDMQIGVLYEQGNHGGIYYGRCSLEWLTHGRDVLQP